MFQFVYGIVKDRAGHVSPSRLALLVLQLQKEGGVAPIGKDIDDMINSGQDWTQVGGEWSLLLGSHKLDKTKTKILVAVHKKI